MTTDQAPSTGSVRTRPQPPRRSRPSYRRTWDGHVIRQLPPNPARDWPTTGGTVLRTLAAIAVPVSLCEVMNRAQGLLRSFYRSGSHRLRVEIAPEADWVRGNPIVIEQIFVNLLINAAECSNDSRLVVVSSSIDCEREGHGA